MSPTPVAPASNHVVILASAGSGKTHRLTTRFLALVARGAPPERILATTFTRKAAGEILERVLRRLSGAAVDGEELARLNEALGSETPPAHLTGEKARAALVGLAQAAHRLSIQTIDSYFFRAASACALELGVAPGWRLTDDSEAADAASLAADDAIGRAAPGELAALFRRLYAGGVGRSAHAALLGLGSDALAPWLATRERPDVWEVVGETDPALDGDALAEAIERVRTAPVRRTASGKENGHWVNARARDTANAEEAARTGDWSGALKGGLLCLALRDAPSYRGEPLPPETLLAYDALARHARGCVLRAFAARSLATRDLGARFCEALDRVKRRAGAFTFDDVPRLLLGAPGSESAERLERLYYRLDGRIDHVLLDEFQDTSVAQFRLLAPILDELCSQAEGGRSVLVVGDVKQSLYAWREAEPALLRTLAGRYPAMAAESMAKSRRSSQVVLDAVNAVFARLATNPRLAGAPGAVAQWRDYLPHAEWVDDRLPAKPGVVRLLAAPLPGGTTDANGARAPISVADQRRATHAFAAARVRAILDRSPNATVGVLVRVGKRIPHLIDCLRRVGVRASEEGGNPLTDSPAVAACLSLLHLLDHPGDTAALFHAATAPVGKAAGLMDPLDPAPNIGAISRLRERVHREGFAPALLGLLRALAPSLDARSFRRFEQLVDLAARFDAKPWARADEFVRFVRRTGVEEASGARVRVMTIHRAKGLEFDAVILPDLERPWAPHRNEILLDREDPLRDPTAACVRPSIVERAAHAGLERLAARAEDRSAGEELCALYVAMTRAATTLEMLVAPTAVKDARRATAARVLLAALAPDAPLAPGATLYEHGDERALVAPAAPERERRPRPPTAAPVRLAPPSPRSLRRARAVSPSSLRADPMVNLAHTFRTGDDAARRAGELAHAMFERIEWLDVSPPTDAALLEGCAALGADGAAFATALARFRRACAAPGVRDSLSLAPTTARAPAGATLRVRREWEFAVRDTSPGAGRTAILRGRFDRVVIAEASGAPVWAEVIDFKTGADPDRPADPALAVAAYMPQMRAYHRAAAALLGLAPDRVRARLVLADSGGALDL